MDVLRAFIWDLDGTLLDSYESIVSGLYESYGMFHVELDKQTVLREVITYSVSAFISKMETETGIKADAVRAAYSEIEEREKDSIRPMKNAPETLRFLKSRGISNYVFTHRGASAEYVLKNTGLFAFFDEIVTGRDGFERKPDPAAINYLVQKHLLDREKTVYVGDRTIDVACANHANIKSILFLPPDSAAKATGTETWVIHDLSEIQACVQDGCRN